MIVRYIVLIDGRLADEHNYHNLLAFNYVEGKWEAMYFWKRSAENYVKRLLVALPTHFHIELRKI